MLLCFDYDGVISDSLGQLYEVAKLAQRAVGAGRPPKLEDFRTLETLTFEHFARKIEIPEDKVKEFSDRFFEILNARNDKVYPFPGMMDIIKKLSKNNTIVIITANLKETVESMFKEYGDPESISLILDEMDEGDKTEKILYSMERFNYTKRETVMIGDTISDIRYGKRAGVNTVAVTWGFHSRELLEKQSPDFIVDTPEELFELLVSSENIYSRYVKD